MIHHSHTRQARSLLGRAEPDLVAVGRLLRDARHRREFTQFCGAVGLHSRKAYDLIATADAVDAGFLNASIVREIGWSKARVIAAQARAKAEARRAVAFARLNTLPAVVAYFKQGGAGPRLITKSFHLTERQAQELEHALLQAGALQRYGRLEYRADALMRILRGYRQPK